MIKNKEVETETERAFKDAFIEYLWEKSWAYITNVVDTMAEPILILDKNLKVMTANTAFYKTFHTDAKNTVNKIVYELGNGEWDIPALKNLLEEIIPKDTYFKGSKVTHEFPYIGRKIIILSASQIHSKKATALHPMILLAMEDVTEMMNFAENLTSHANEIKSKLDKHTKALKNQIQKLEKELEELRNNPE